MTAQAVTAIPPAVGDAAFLVAALARITACTAYGTGAIALMMLAAVMTQRQSKRLSHTSRSSKEFP
ncbi:hypothetical protein SMD44_p10228 (plasmid) [Streptomyces alboflavus]|uniref:Uncharacterized protein n=1 Tax=Streptomyces alboflavus TaxID=67267 RepID=A0A291W486_9ACTN|nr:hypothetical protein SMD44_p10228 [Streptomyces alboflavus]